MMTPAGQRWTRERPTEPGWYWFRRKKGDGAIQFTSVVEVVRIHGKLFMSDTGDLALHHYNSDKYMRGYEWQGPISPNEATA